MISTAQAHTHTQHTLPDTPKATLSSNTIFNMPHQSGLRTTASLCKLHVHTHTYFLQGLLVLQRETGCLLLQLCDDSLSLADSIAESPMLGCQLLYLCQFGLRLHTGNRRGRGERRGGRGRGGRGGREEGEGRERKGETYIDIIHSSIK